MIGTVLQIEAFQLALTMIFVLVIGSTSLALRLKLERDLAVGTIRTFAQLFLMGYVLKLVFAVSVHWLTLLVFLVMTAAAAQIIHGRVKEREVPYLGSVFLSMLVSYFAVSVMVTGVIVQARPWWQPQYFIPLSGMVVGNSMSALAISLERLFSDLRKKRDQVEMKLCLGADYKEASAEIVTDALRAGMMPSINSMMGVGLVFIPGMMTGQILAGADPLVAIRYQIVVMLMLVASAGMGAIIVVLLVRRKCFGRFQELKIRKRNRNG